MIICPQCGGQVKAWSMAAFDAAREQYYQQHPTVMDAWRALGSKES